jgi:hypothetical protein
LSPFNTLLGRTLTTISGSNVLPRYSVRVHA